MRPIDPCTLTWLRGLADFGVTFMELIPGEKRTKGTWDRFDMYHQDGGGSRQDLAIRWLERGSGVGYRPAGGLWVLDVDSPEEVERVAYILADAWIFPPFLSTPSGGRHFLFRFPPGFPRENLKNHVCHPFDADERKLDMDFKLGNRTMLVAPGTVLKGKTYQPETEWRTPPIVDPRMFLPEGRFWRGSMPFIVDQRPQKDRVVRACQYLKSPKTPVSISGSGGGKTLRTVATHLVVFLGLDPELALNLLTHGVNPWNTRCKDQNGQPYPWPLRDLWNACRDAVDSVPGAGRSAYYRQQSTLELNRRLDGFIDLLRRSLTAPASTRVSVETLRVRFMQWSGLKVSETSFGEALTRAGIRRILFTKRRVCGVERCSLTTLDTACEDGGAFAPK